MSLRAASISADLLPWQLALLTALSLDFGPWELMHGCLLGNDQGEGMGAFQPDSQTLFFLFRQNIQGGLWTFPELRTSEVGRGWLAKFKVRGHMDI